MNEPASKGQWLCSLRIASTFTIGAASGGFTLTDLGAASGDRNSRAFGIGPNGQATGESDGGATAAEATLYANGAATNINTLGAAVSQGQAVNGSNKVTGFADVSTGRHAFLYSNGVMRTSITAIFPGGSIGYGINRAGQVVGQGFTDRSLNTFHAFLYNNGRMLDIGTLGGTQATAFAINDSGQIVGRSVTSRVSLRGRPENNRPCLARLLRALQIQSALP